MKILILVDRFWPEIGAPAFRSMAHAQAWVGEGHEVSVVTGVPNHPAGKPFAGYRNILWQEEWKDGVRIVRVWTYMTRNEGVVKRTLDYASYMLSVIATAPRLPDFDVVLASSPTFFTAIAGWALSVVRDRPWVFELRDLWPASIRAVGASHSPILALVERLELFLYGRADRILSVTRSFRDDLVQRGIPSNKIDIVTNGVDLSEFSPEQATFDARAALGVSPNAILAGYIGTVGMAHGLETLLDAAERLRAHPEIVLLIVGDGAARQRLEADSRRRGLSNVLFRDFVSHDLVPSYLAALDISVVHLRPDPVFRTVIPSKIFESMAMGVPILMAVEGESADLVRDAGAGLCIPSGDARAMAEAILALAADENQRARLGGNGRTAAATKYGRQPLALAALGSLKATVAQARETRP